MPDPCGESASFYNPLPNSFTSMDCTVSTQASSFLQHTQARRQQQIYHQPNNHSSSNVAHCTCGSWRKGLPPTKSLDDEMSDVPDSMQGTKRKELFEEAQAWKKHKGAGTQGFGDQNVFGAANSGNSLKRVSNNHNLPYSPAKRECGSCLRNASHSSY